MRFDREAVVFNSWNSVDQIPDGIELFSHVTPA